jgi:hypothetical protein
MRNNWVIKIQGPSQPLRALTSPLNVFRHVPCPLIICTYYIAWGAACPYRSGPGGRGEQDLSDRNNRQVAWCNVAKIQGESRPQDSNYMGRAAPKVPFYYSAQLLSSQIARASCKIKLLQAILALLNYHAATHGVRPN